MKNSYKYNFLFLLIFCIFPVFGFSQLSLNVISDGGAIGDGIADDRNAIQAVFDQIGAAGGGTAFFPEGIYKVSPVANSVPLQVICLDIPENIEIAGAGNDLSVIRLADNVGNYDAIIGNFPSFQQVDNVHIHDITIDGNGLNNPVSGQAQMDTDGKRNLFRIYLGFNHLIENCHFTNSQGVWNIVYNGICENVVIRNNFFDEIGGNTADWDHSTIYTSGDDFLIENNVFQSRFGAGTLGARTAIEIHGSNQIIRNNLINGFSYGINVTGYADFYFSRNQVYYNNVFEEMMEGFVFWSGLNNDPAFANGLGNIAVFDNEISINADGWKDWQFFSGGAGFAFDRTRDRNIDSLFVFKNKIGFMGSPVSTVDESRRSSGLRMGSNVLDYPVSVNDFYFEQNEIANCNGAGIYLESKTTNSYFGGNTILNAGSSTAQLYTGFRSAYFLNDTVQNLQFSCNEILNNNPAATLDNEVFQNSTNLGESYFFNNGFYDPSNEGFFIGPDATGPSWLMTTANALVNFSLDSIGIAPGQGQTAIISLSQAVDEAIEIMLYPIDGNYNYGTAWESDFLTVPFAAGQTSAEIVVSNMLSEDDATWPAYLQIMMGDGYQLGCNALMEINLAGDSVLSAPNLLPLEKALKVFPNPTKDHISFTLEQSLNGTTARVFDISGKIVLEQEVNGGINQISVDDLSKGYYILKIDGVINSAFVKY